MITPFPPEAALVGIDTVDVVVFTVVSVAGGVSAGVVVGRGASRSNLKLSLS